jgi:hypothetical protein
MISTNGWHSIILLMGRLFKRWGYNMVASSGPLIQSKEPKPQMGKLGPSASKQGKEAEKTKIMDSAQIILQFFTQQSGNRDQANKILNSIASKIKNKTIQLVQIGNTVFVVSPKPDKSAEFYSISIEPKNLAKRIKALSNTLKQMGFLKMYSISVTPESETLSKETGLPIKRTQTQMMNGNRMVPAYRYEVQL